MARTVHFEPTSSAVHVALRARSGSRTGPYAYAPNSLKKNGAGKYNWGTWTDGVVDTSETEDAKGVQVALKRKAKQGSAKSAKGTKRALTSVDKENLSMDITLPGGRNASTLESQENLNLNPAKRFRKNVFKRKDGFVDLSAIARTSAAVYSSTPLKN